MILQVYISDASNVPNHCCVHALSDQKQPLFQVQRQSFPLLQRTTKIYSCFHKVICQKFSRKTHDKRDVVIFTCQQSIAVIEAWKQHQLRSIQRDKARTDILAK